MDRSRNFAVFYMESADALTAGSVSLRSLDLGSERPTHVIDVGRLQEAY
tara:strand:+ start:257 stop:403 length:147 start_codon:yes stop_codon:yes gene_type:complete